MTTTKNLTVLQERVFSVIRSDWMSTAEINKAIGQQTRMVLSALYTRGYIARQPISAGRPALQWRLEQDSGVQEVR